MLVVGEEEIERMQPSITYLASSVDRSEAFLADHTKRLPKRVSKEDLFEAFKRGGFLRSYTMRMKITGREFQSKKVPIKPTSTS